MTKKYPTKARQSPAGVKRDWTPAKMQGVRVKDEKGVHKLHSDGTGVHHGTNQHGKKAGH